MCGRYYIESEDEAIEIRIIMEEVNRGALAATAGGPITPIATGEIFPTNYVPVITLKGDAIHRCLGRVPKPLEAIEVRATKQIGFDLR